VIDSPVVIVTVSPALIVFAPPSIVDHTRMLPPDPDDVPIVIYPTVPQSDPAAVVITTADFSFFTPPVELAQPAEELARFFLEYVDPPHSPVVAPVIASPTDAPVDRHNANARLDMCPAPVDNAVDDRPNAESNTRFSM
jgi:hypothetical protein